MLSEISQTEKDKYHVYFHLYVESKKQKENKIKQKTNIMRTKW